MKRLLLSILGCISLSLFFTVTAFADMRLTTTLPESVKQGDKVPVVISAADNTGVSTLGLRLEYDPSELSYVNDAWSSAVTSGGNRLKLASDTAQGDKRAVNISLVDSSGYQGNGDLVTLNFTAQKDIAKPAVSLVFRDATDAAETPITSLDTGSVVYLGASDAAGAQSSGQQVVTGTSVETSAQTPDAADSTPRSTPGNLRPVLGQDNTGQSSAAQASSQETTPAAPSQPAEQEDAPAAGPAQQTSAPREYDAAYATGDSFSRGTFLLAGGFIAGLVAVFSVVLLLVKGV